MGGIAAEAMAVGAAEGGAADEAALRALLGAAQGTVGQLNDEEMRKKAWWAVSSATVLLRERCDAYDKYHATGG